jgi:glutamate carboxypeptidase
MMDKETVINAINEMEPAMLETWQKLVGRDCGPDNKAGVDAVGRDVQHFLEPLGFHVRFHTYEKAGNMLVAEYGDMTRPFIILTGHMDTVFAKGTASERPFQITGDKVTGPGVLDMKGGLTILLHVVKFLVKQGYDRYPIKIILAGDEETGHKNSGAGMDYLEEAKGALMGFNLETGFPDNGIVIERKGVAQYRFDIDGIGAHAGNNPKDGRSAVMELCHKALDMESLTDYEEGTTVNVGVISGGTVANAIPEHASCRVDVRYSREEGIERVEKAFRKIAEKTYVQGTKTHVECLVKVSSMERLPASEDLFHRAEEIAKEWNLPHMKAIAVGGGSDSAYLTGAGIPTLCALGVKGEFNHTVREWADKKSLTERAKLLAALLLQL